LRRRRDESVLDGCRASLVFDLSIQATLSCPAFLKSPMIGRSGKKALICFDFLSRNAKNRI
jgi:hypothetical protein